MRVIGGIAKGVKLKSTPTLKTRPILDRVKTSLFDIIRNDIQGKKFLDLFAGTGSVGIEALSQGADSCYFIDIDPVAIKVIKENLAKTRLTDRAFVTKKDAFLFLKTYQKDPFDFIYIAPPQYKGMWSLSLMELAKRPHLIAEDGYIIAQIDPKEDEELELFTLFEVKRKKYGNTLLLFYKRLNNASL